MEASKPLFKRVLLKLSGEALMGGQTSGLDLATIERICSEIKEAHIHGVEQAIVVGGGNIFRGLNGEAQGIERTTSDHMGMLATVINALALQSKLEQMGIETRVMSAISMQSICEPYIRRRAAHHMEKGRIIICAAGTGNPYFTTDSAAALRASELNCEALMKATKVDGVYDKDPMKHKDATFYPELTYQKVLTEDLRVLDTSAIALARESKIPILVFSILNPHGIMDALKGKGRFTVIK
ncbi:MAG: Uridylate kinase [uncultured bacterium]|nr:MAG: Uridylate kinase [uncultured bacterium]OFW68647.1 MAG: UMP kinase [Alphaproteobacteria bacterium GWC2_42_16]OFW73231.1 MAG: UMP kinase [Alphaproteobacteria bacterium GWA2_41_27]OFW81759.1 MAG: UMP kinase [Alphaproteobacteria bacterium RIFCSPHIGHO2_12_FULL_42_100]OFW85593.1 MAG: UMP kinase [Alphaproteobacteria bacterium RBG_16_42_14]OFW90764.1 MAG: UMP kinase [Alphaproteobacteria bacterium RIFCSPHIGHO2_02_FULL_42_30]OFW92835.1 MAG: UMP kinase [Alphaproteobacteria bacterium RIFCSPHIGHO2